MKWSTIPSLVFVFAFLVETGCTRDLARFAGNADNLNSGTFCLDDGVHFTLRSGHKLTTKTDIACYFSQLPSGQTITSFS